MTVTLSLPPIAYRRRNGELTPLGREYRALVSQQLQDEPRLPGSATVQIRTSLYSVEHENLREAVTDSLVFAGVVGRVEVCTVDQAADLVGRIEVTVSVML